MPNGYKNCTMCKWVVIPVEQDDICSYCQKVLQGVRNFQHASAGLPLLVKLHNIGIRYEYLMLDLEQLLADADSLDAEVIEYADSVRNSYFRRQWLEHKFDLRQKYQTLSNHSRRSDPYGPTNFGTRAIALARLMEKNSDE